MRILALGMGGAGGRIAAALYANDRKSSKVTCVQALVIDIDSEALARLTALPDQTKIDFSTLEPGISGQGSDAEPATVDIGEILARIQNMERSEIDAILICCGLGGRMTDAVPRLVAALRESVSEPIFGLVTLPALSEGERRSAKAADDIDAISPLLDGVILFDNETWLKKIAARRDALVEEIAKGPGLFGLGRNAPKLTPREITDKLLNQNIVRRISLLLRAGEFRADGGIDLAEVVLDSSEVLNTIRGMGFISVGYAVENVSQGPLAFFARLRGTDSAQEQRKSAERIIDLAKQAIYQEVSVPCDMTSAAKALILVAGPSHEISMKGFMTVRKWIDRSIAGMEMRSGDYPVTNSENVAIIVVLSGLENIPRITELRAIRDQGRTGVARSPAPTLTLPAGGDRKTTGEVSAITTVWSGTDIQDEMILLPRERPSKREGSISPEEEERVPPLAPSPPARASPSPFPETRRQQAVRPRIQEETEPIRQQSPSASLREVPSKPAVSERGPSQRVPPGGSPGKGEVGGYPPAQRSGYRAPSPGPEDRPPAKRTLESGYEGNLPLRSAPVQRRMPPLQVPRQDLQKTVKPAGPEDGSTQPRSPRPPETRTLIRKVMVKPQAHTTISPREAGEQVPVQPHKMIIRQKKKEPTPSAEREDTPDAAEYTAPVRQEELDILPEENSIPAPAQAEETKIGIRDRSQPVRDDMFLGKAIPVKAPLKVKDEALLQAELKPRKIRFVTDEGDPAGEPEDSKKFPAAKKGRSHTLDDDRA